MMTMGRGFTFEMSCNSVHNYLFLFIVVVIIDGIKCPKLMPISLRLMAYLRYLCRLMTLKLQSYIHLELSVFALKSM